MRRYLTVAILLAAARSTAAQSVRVTVVEGTNRAPVVGAIVSLIDSAGIIARRGLSDDRGRVSLRAAKGGRYHVRADRIGFRGLDSGPVVVPDTGTINFGIVMPDEPVVLAEISVTSESRCVNDPGTAAGTASLWTEIRKALDATAIAKGAGLSFTMALWRRELNADLKLKFEQTDTVETSVPRPFFAADPVALVTQGYVVPGEKGSTYFGPDEATLLSPGFLATHCFHLNRRVIAGRSQLGLRFEPVAGRKLPDIAGTMWVDTDSRALSEVDYRYRNVGPEERLGGTATGRVEFMALPEGWWVVSRWNIRMPHLQEVRIVSRAIEGETIERRRMVRGYFEDGGALVQVKGPPRGYASITGRLQTGDESVRPLVGRPADPHRSSSSGERHGHACINTACSATLPSAPIRNSSDSR